MSLRVTHVVRQYTPSIGGMEEVVRSIAADQLRIGQRPRVITLNRLFRNSVGVLQANEVVEGVPVKRLAYSGSSRYPLCPQVIKELRDSDVVHVHGVDFFYDYLAATKSLHRRPLLLSTHGGFFHTEFASRIKDFWFRTITRASSRAYERIVATSENDGSIFSRIIPPDQLQVIENGVDTHKYSDAASKSLQRRLLYFGRWSSNKGLMEALDFIRALINVDARWQLIIAGREYDFSLSELEREVKVRALENHVQLASNPSISELCELMAQCSYFLCLSRHEGFGLAAIEAMSAGLTPLLSDIPPFRRLVENAHLGVLFQNQQHDRNVQILLELHGLGELAASKRRSEVMAFAAQYSWSKVARRYFDVYAELERGA